MYTYYGSVPRLGLRFFSLRTTSVIDGYGLIRKINRCIWTWFQDACTCVLEMIISTLSLNQMLTEMLQRIRNVLQVTWRRCDNVSGMSCKLLEEDVTTYEEHLASYLKNYLQRIRNVLQLTDRRCYNASGTSGKLLECNVTTYQKGLESDLRNMLQRIRIHHASPLNPPHAQPRVPKSNPKGPLTCSLM
jgi:proline dehydrogenase